MQKILWADDEIDLLKPHILFLKSKGYEIVTVNNGRDALDILDSEPFSLVLLDENMPGLTGLETLSAINRRHPDLPKLRHAADRAGAIRQKRRRHDKRRLLRLLLPKRRIKHDRHAG